MELELSLLLLGVLVDTLVGEYLVFLESGLVEPDDLMFQLALWGGPLTVLLVE